LRFDIVFLGEPILDGCNLLVDVIEVGLQPPEFVLQLIGLPMQVEDFTVIIVLPLLNGSFDRFYLLCQRLTTVL